MNHNPNQRKIFEMIQNHQITSEEGLQLFREQQRSIKAGLITDPEKPAPIYFQNEWTKTEPDSQTAGDGLSGNILVFDLNDGLTQRMKQGSKAQVVLVKHGEKYQDLGDLKYVINPKRREDYSKLLEELHHQKFVPDRIIHLWSRDSFTSDREGIEDQLEKGIYSVLYLTQALMEQKPKNKIHLSYVYFSGIKNPVQPQYAAVSGLAKTVQLENPNFIFTTVEVRKTPVTPSETDGSLDPDYILQAVAHGDREETEVRYQDGERWVKRYQEFRLGSEPKVSLPLKEKGVYLITGGVGGLGLIFARYLAERFRANLVLADRADLNDDQKKKLAELEQMGSEVLYLKADLSRRPEVEGLIAKAKSHFRKIDGIIHGAGVLRDSFIIKKSREEMDQVLAPKVFGAINLDDATRDEPLDFFVFFSSVAGVIGNVGQVDYAYANRFMDHLAEWRISQKRPGRTLSISWPLWKEGGMKVDQDALLRFNEKMGLIPLSTANGLKAFEDGLKSTIPQLIVFEGKANKIKNLFQWGFSKELTDDKHLESPENGKDQFQEKSEVYLKNILSQVLKLPVSKIQSQEPFEKYGIDSIIIMNLNREFENHFGELPKTLLFEYKNVKELAGYFVESHRRQLIEKIGISLDNRVEKAKPAAEVKIEPAVNRPRFFRPEAAAAREVETGREEIAIIGLSGRYPMAKNMEELWENLKAGRDSVTEIPPERWDYRKYYDENREKKGTSYSKWGGFIDDVDKFDPLFFNISPRDAEFSDPQERIFLETVWQTIEDAGYTRSSLSNNKVGVFVGVMYGHYQLYGVEESHQGKMIALNSSYASIANRVSYYFDFQGPSIALDTMCSSSLTTIHLACESIRSRESEVAIAGGVNVSIHPNKYILLSQGNFVSSDGRCRSFGEGGDGYVPGEGVGAVLLKPLQKAIRDGDHIYAVIKGSSINHGGKTNGYTVPNPNAQADLILETLRKSKVDPRTISYLEAHGTGTSLGDPIEIAGLMKAFSRFTGDKQYCSIGSIKSNIGHLESAAGIAGITKVLLQMKYQQLVPSIHSRHLNPGIDFLNSPFYVQQDLADWQQPVISENGAEKSYPRRAGISAFGAGGSNAHLIFEEYQRPVLTTAWPAPGLQLIVLSAKNEERLKAYLEKVAGFLERYPGSKGEPELKNGISPGIDPGDEVELINIAFTLQVGREPMEERVAFAVSTIEELKQSLAKYQQNTDDTGNVFRGNIKSDKSSFQQIIEGKEGTEFIEDLIHERQLEKLAQLWVSGVDIDWALFYQNDTPQRISLPTYPFARKRCWVGSYRESLTSSVPAVSSLNINHHSFEDKIKPDLNNKINSARQPESTVTQYHGDEVILKVVDESIAIVVMQDRRNKNVFTEEIMAGLTARFQEIKQNPKLKVIIVTGYDNVFCMGGTQAQLLNIAGKKSSFNDVPFLYRGLLEAEIPVISAIQGHATGGGLLFGLYADMVVMSEESVYSAVFTKYGFTPGMGATFILKEKLGHNLATEMMFTARSFRGDELKNRSASVIFKKSREVLQEAVSMARMLSTKPVHTLKILKKELAGRILEQLPAIIERELEMHEQTFAQPEVRQRIQQYYPNSGKEAESLITTSAQEIAEKEVIEFLEKTKVENWDVDEVVQYLEEIYG
jgi:3-oxoacyl-(acyl-carrier-protein) synthase/enoyl-CoA hydratase/carnithine racemase/acyl carrier protein